LRLHLIQRGETFGFVAAQREVGGADGAAKEFYVPQRYFDAGPLKTFVDSSINWNLIRAHHKDFMKVVLSIQAGKILPSTLLRILTSYSSK
jgi:TnpA family transposase